MSKDFLLTEKYRPKTINECILPESLKNRFLSYVESKNLPNLIFYGPSGLGKTSVAKSLLNDLGYDFIFINGSLQNSIDDLRTHIQDFVTTVSFTGARKAVLIDEAERMSAAMQDGMKSFMEEFCNNVTFILTSNNYSRITDHLKSRAAGIDFAVSKEDAKPLLSLFFKRLIMILNQENIQYDKTVVAKVLAKFFPDFRRVLNEIQSYSRNNSAIDTGILNSIKDLSIKELFAHMKTQNFTEIRTWVSENTSHYSEIYRKIFDTANEYFTSNTVPMVILTVAKYQFQSTVAVDQEVNLTACLIEIMIDCELK